MKLIALLSTAVLLLAGCASNELSLNVDIYRDDPQYSTPLSVREIARLNLLLEGSLPEAANIVQERIDLGKSLVSAYAELTLAVTKKELSSTSAVYEYLAGYTNILTRELEQASALARETRTKMEKYLDLQRAKAPQTTLAVAQAEISESVEQYKGQLVRLAGPLKSDFEEQVVESWKNIVASAKANNIALTGQSADKKVAASIGRLQEKIQESAKSQPDRVKAITKSPDDALTSGVSQMVRSPGLTGQAANLVEQFALSTVDFERNQNPSDPMWRVISTPENASRWNRFFSTNYFQAKGNSSVVVVRDGPTTFRVQRGNNNPTALVESQFQISHAIADAAITVAGSAMGAKLSLPALNNSSSSNAAPAIATADSAESLRGMRRITLDQLRTDLALLGERASKITDAQTDEKKKLVQDLKNAVSAVIPSLAEEKK